MLSIEHKTMIDDIIGHSEYTACYFYSEISSNQLIKICVGESVYILKIYENKYCFEKEIDVMFLLSKNKCKVPKLVKFGSISSQSWILYEYVEGESLDRMKIQLSPKELKKNWKQVGKELRKIHSISTLTDHAIEKNKIDFIRRIENTMANFNICLDEKDTSPLLLDAFHFLKNNFFRIEKSLYGIVLYDLAEKHIIIKHKNGKWDFNGFVDFEQTRFACLYVDLAALYINTLLDEKELEENFWKGYGGEKSIIEIYFFVIYFGVELCTVLRNVNIHHYDFGLSIVKKGLEKIYIR